jgi:transposase
MKARSSNGEADGRINRLKISKRQIHGRPNSTCSWRA